MFGELERDLDTELNKCYAELERDLDTELNNCYAELLGLRNNYDSFLDDFRAMEQQLLSDPTNLVIVGELARLRKQDRQFKVAIQQLEVYYEALQQEESDSLKSQCDVTNDDDDDDDDPHSHPQHHGATPPSYQTEQLDLVAQQESYAACLATLQTLKMQYNQIRQAMTPLEAQWYELASSPGVDQGPLLLAFQQRIDPVYQPLKQQAVELEATIAQVEARLRAVIARTQGGGMSLFGRVATSTPEYGPRPGRFVSPMVRAPQQLFHQASQHMTASLTPSPLYSLHLPNQSQ